MRLRDIRVRWQMVLPMPGGSCSFLEPPSAPSARPSPLKRNGMTAIGKCDDRAPRTLIPLNRTCPTTDPLEVHPLSFQFAGLDHVQVAAPQGCEEQARSFFSGLLGWPEIAKPEALRGRGGVWFVCGAHQVHIGVQDAFVPATKAHPAFHVHGLDSLRIHLQGRGVQVIDDDLRDAEGVRRFYLHDPFGNRLEFLEWE